MNFTFLHCADLHLGSPLIGLSLKDKAVAGRFAAASREAFSDLVTRALEERVAFVLIAGDIYDGEWKDNSIGLFFNREVARFARAGIPVFVIKGNHDAESVVTGTVPLPESVRLFSARKAETVRLEQLRVAIHGRSYSERAVTENLALSYPPLVAGWFNIGLLHTACSQSGHDNYAPCSVNDLASRGYNYWALGHVHERKTLLKDPWIVFPGNLQGRHARELGPKGGVFVDVADGFVTGLRDVDVDRARWVEAVVPVGAAQATQVALDAVKTRLLAACAGSRDRLVAARVRLTGETALHREFVARRTQLRDDIQAMAEHELESVWLERLVIETREPARQARKAGDAADAFDIAALIDGCAADAGVRARALDLLDTVNARMPQTATEDVAPLADDIATLMQDARGIVLARLSSQDAG